MNKFIKMCISLIIVVCLMFIGLSLYVGNYIYDYTLNTASQHYLGKNINDKDEEKAKDWLHQHGENVFITSYDGLKLKGTYIENESSIVMIMVHGYRADGASIIGPIQEMAKRGYNLLIPDLRGHGESEGDYIGMGWDDRKDIIQWIDFLIHKQSNVSIVLYGVSMGGATVLNVSGEQLPNQVKAIISDCGYTNLWDLFQYHFQLNNRQSRYLYQMANIVTKIRAGYKIGDSQPIEQVKKCHLPIMFIHGKDDDFIPNTMAYDLYNATKGPKEILIVNGAGHANSCSVDSNLYYSKIQSFIDKYTKKEA